MKHLLTLLCVIAFKAFAYAQPILYGVTNGNSTHSTFSKFETATKVLTAEMSFEIAEGFSESLTRTHDGLLYGLSELGGAYHHGVIFSYDPKLHSKTVRHNFDGLDGSKPKYNSLLDGGDGNLYGMTTYGGTYGRGVIFSFNTSTGLYEVKYTFTGVNGSFPYGSLIKGTDGVFYGMTTYGGRNDRGVIFSFEPTSNTFNLKHHFEYEKGYYPHGKLLQGKDGLLYGMTSQKGDFGTGVIFSLDPTSNQYAIRYVFNFINGAYPYGSLIEGNDGLIYGLTSQGGSNYGVIFSFNSSNDFYEVKHKFNYTNGGFPYGNLMQTSDGLMYGMTQGGGSHEKGTIFSYNPTSNSFSHLQDFDGNNGSFPYIGSVLVETVVENCTTSIINSCPKPAEGNNSFLRAVEGPNCNYKIDGTEFDITVNPECIGKIEYSYNLNGSTVTSNRVFANTLRNVILNNGETTITWFAKDNEGNESTCSFIVSVKDVSPPVFISPQDQSLYISANCSFTVPDLRIGLTGNDNCGIVSFSQDPLPGTLMTSRHNETLNITITADDGNGNTVDKTVQLKLKDQIPPSITIPFAVTIDCNASKIPAYTGIATATDNCDPNPSVTYTDRSTQTATGRGYQNYTIIRAWKAEDAAGNYITEEQIITVQDVTAPTVVSKPLEVYLDLNGSISIRPDQIDGGSTDNCDTEFQLSLDRLTFTSAGTYSVQLTGSDASGNSSSSSSTVVVKKRPTIITYTGDGMEQYSDVQLLSAVLIDKLTGTALRVKTIKFTLGIQSVTTTSDENGFAFNNLVITQQPFITHELKSEFSGDEVYEGSVDMEVFQILAENARSYYTGALFASTSSKTSNLASVTLSVTVKDITAENGDHYPGDIRNAKVTFVDKETGLVLASNVPIGLVNESDLLIGTATTTVLLDIGATNSKTFTVGTIITNFYSHNASAENTIVSISRLLDDNFITGGGYILLDNSAGDKKGDIGTKNNFGFNVKSNKNSTDLQGNVNTIIRRTESDGILHVYQIKSNGLTSLSVSSHGTAVFNGKAIIQDITNPDLIVSVDGNASMQFNITDKGEPGLEDLIGITIWNKYGGLWFASSWNGTRTNEQKLGGGNLKVNSNNSVVLPAITNFEKTETEEKLRLNTLHVRALPNPAKNYFTLTVTSPRKHPLNVRLLDLNGRLVEAKINVASNGTVRIGHHLRPGVYYVEVLQRQERVILKVIKIE